MPIIRVAMLALALGLGVGTAWAQEWGSAAPDRFFRVEATGGQGRGGRPIVSGYIYNNYGNAAGRIQLAVESLDTGGQVVGRSLLHVDGDIPPYNRLYFEVPVGTAGASYRTRIHYFEWIRSGGAGS
jgi:hypothetical protein